MNWKFDNVMQEHQLLDGGTPLAKIQTEPRKKGGFVVKSLVSFIYYGQQTQTEMEKQNKEWVAYRRKFKDRKEAQDYVQRKKEVVKRFIEAREKEME